MVRRALLAALWLSLAPALARARFFGILGGSTVCSECNCTDAGPFLINCTERSLTADYTSGDTWPANKSSIRLLYDKNSLTKVSELPALDVTDLSYQRNDIASVVDGAFQHLRRLRRLDLSHNKLTRAALGEKTFRGAFSADDYQPLPLQSLDLSYNEIHSIFDDVFSHFSGTLLELDLSRNPLPLLDHHTVLALTSLSRLRALQLAGCGLRQLPTGLLHALNTLHHLDLAHNQLADVPKDFQNSHAIQTVRLDNNPIKFVDADSFNGMVELEVINMSMMPQLEYIAENAFSTLRKLRVLRCRNNPKLWSISPHIFRGMDTSAGIFPLQELFLNGNNLTTLSVETVPFWEKLLQAELHDNPWRCDCQLQWLADLLPQWEENDQRSVDRVVCQTPAALTGVALARADAPLVCAAEPPPAFTRGGSSSTLAAALVVGSMVIFATAGVVACLVWRRNKIREIYRAKQQIRYRRAAMDEEVEVDDGRPAVNA